MVTRVNRRWLAAVSAVGLCVAIGAFIALQTRPAGVGDLATSDRAELKVRPDGAPGKREGASPLRCFVEGRFVGDMTIQSCAQRNGVAAQGLDVGLAAPPDSAAADPSSSPGQKSDRPAAFSAPAARLDAPTAVASDGQACMRFADDGWRTVARSLPLAACVHALYEGRCVDPGDALYGRSGELTLRLVQGRVESSDDDRRFHLVMTQNDDCTLDG